MSFIERVTYWIIIGVLFVFCVVLEINDGRKEQVIKAYDVVVAEYSKIVKDLLNQNFKCEFDKKNTKRVQILYDKERR